MSHKGQVSHATALSEVRSANHGTCSGAHSGPQHNIEEDVESRGEGAASPKAARSQISTALSCEGAKPAGSAAIAARSAGGDSAHSFADPDCENSSMPRPVHRHSQLAQPTTSLLSTAVRNTSPPPRKRAPGSPELYRASSVVSHTEAGAGHNPCAGRAGTPASVYAQGRVLPASTHARGTSPQASHAEGQNSGSDEGRHSRNSRRAVGPQAVWAGRSTDNQAVHSHMPPQLSVAAAPRNVPTGTDGGARDQPGVYPSRPSAGRGPKPLKKRPSSGMLDITRDIAAGESPEVSQHAGGSRPPSSSGRGRPRSDRQLQSRSRGSPQPRDDHADGSTAMQDRHRAIPGLSPTLSSAMPHVHQAAAPQLFNQGSVTKPTAAEQLPIQPLCTQGSTPNPAPSQPANGRGEQIGNATPDAAEQAYAREGELEAQAGPVRACNGRQPSAEGQPKGQEHTGQDSRSLDARRGGQLGHGGEPHSGVMAEGLEASLSRQGVQHGPSHSRESSHHQASPQGPQASAQAQINGQVLWGHQATPVDSSRKSAGAANNQDCQSLQAEEQAGNSVLGTLVEQDWGSHMEVGMGGGGGWVHAPKAAKSQASHQPAEVAAALMQEQSYQGSVMPTPSANGEAAVAQALGPEAETPASLLSGVARSQLATKRVEAAGTQKASVKQPKSSQNQKAESVANGIGAQGNSQYTQSGKAGNSSGPSAPSFTPHLPGQPPQFNPDVSPENHSSASGAAPANGSGPPTVSPPSSNGHLQNASLSGGFPAVATVGPVGEAEGFELVVQSQPPPAGASEAYKPKPALTVVMQGGLVGPSTEPDDGAVGPMGRGRQQQGQDTAQGNSSAKGKANSETTSPSSTGRPKREASKRRRTIAGFSPGHN